ncbi:MAG: peptidyl-prolyl cis-trans isomerase, partial [Panacagrimonas sp.]
MKKTAMRLLRAPLLHFLVLGGLIHAVLALRPETIVLADRDLAEIDAQWLRETGRAPSPAERAASRQRAADEEMLVREALRLGLETRDPVVRARLLRNIALIEGPGAPADALA